MAIMVMDRPDLVKFKDLITDRESLVHVSRLRPFKHPKDMSSEKIESLVAADLDEFYVLGILVRARIPNDGNFQFVGVDTSRRTIPCTKLDWSAVKDFAALDDYSKENPHLNLG